jgi:hypothetical protein
VAPLPTTSPAYTASNSDRGSERYGDFATLREDVGKKISPSPLEGDVDVVACSQPRLTPGRVLVRAAFDPPRIPAARPNPLMVPTRRFHQAVASTASVLLKGPQFWGKVLINHLESESEVLSVCAPGVLAPTQHAPGR